MDKNNCPSYDVVIRTIGKAGDKYQETLNSVARQTVRPQLVLVFIPYGYDIPKETIGIERYIRCEKGMVAQRAQAVNYISSEYILFLDDDLSFGDNYVEKLFDGLLAEDGDCICPDIYREHEQRTIIKIRDFFGGTRPHFKKRWSFLVRLDGHYSYNPHPSKMVLQSQSGSGASCLCKASAFRSVHYEDERWIGYSHFSLGEDQLLFYKLFKYGFKLLTSFETSISHLDAGSGHAKQDFSDYSAQGFCRYAIWYRTIYSEKKTRFWHFRCKLAWALCNVSALPLTIAVILKYKSFKPYRRMLDGVTEAKRFIRSVEYAVIPGYYDHKR